MEAENSTKILIVVPAFNESGNVAQTIREIKALPIPTDVVVIDDGSSDATASEAEQAGAPVIVLPFNLGIGGAVQTGFQYALQKGYTTVVQVDGDGQHDVRYLPDLLNPVSTQQIDMVIGSRFLQPLAGYQSSFIRRIGIHFFARLISFLIREPVTDPTSGFRAYGRRAIDIFAESYPQDYPEPESIVVAKRQGLVLCEVPVEMRKRFHGHSSIRYLWTLYYMIKVTLAILLSMLKQNRKS